MKQIIYTCDVCGNTISEIESEKIFTFPVHVGWHTSKSLITTPNPPKIISKSYMLCKRCQYDIADYLLDRDFVSD